MKKLGDQWIEVIDGREHMVKVGLSMKGEACRGCIYMGRVDECSHPCGCPMKNQFDPTTIVKDLGPVNEDGCLPSDFGVYPEVYEHMFMGINGYKVNAYITDPHVGKYALGETRQEAIDAWNRRV